MRRVAFLAALLLAACGTDGPQASAPFGPPWPWQLVDAASAARDGAAPADAGGNDAPAPSSDGGPDGDAAPPAPRSPALAVYWGQNVYGGNNPSAPQNWETSLDQTCANNPQYDIVMIAGVIKFTGTNNMSGLPEENFANHCSTPYDARDPTYLKCDAIAQGIRACQALGKRVLLSLGGGVAGYGLASDAEAKVFAQTVWDAFLGGTGAMRTFGTAVPDGIALDIESGTPTGYAAFATKLRALGGKKLLITAAPHCIYPDPQLGPASGTALGAALGSFDYLFVQFIDDAACEYSTSPLLFKKSWDQWAALGPKIFVGLPSAAAAATSGYVTRANLPALVSSVKSNAAFGGIMLDEASYDQNSAQAGVTYGAYAASLIR
jgi:chitinase